MNLNEGVLQFIIDFLRFDEYIVFVEVEWCGTVEWFNEIELILELCIDGSILCFIIHLFFLVIIGTDSVHIGFLIGC